MSICTQQLSPKVLSFQWKLNASPPGKAGEVVLAVTCIKFKREAEACGAYRMAKGGDFAFAKALGSCQLQGGTPFFSYLKSSLWRGLPTDTHFASLSHLKEQLPDVLTSFVNVTRFVSQVSIWKYIPALVPSNAVNPSCSFPSKAKPGASPYGKA